MTEEQIQNAIRKVGMFGILGFPDAGILVKAVETLQQQNKQLIDELQWIKLHSNERHIVQRAVAALQQIQGNK